MEVEMVRKYNGSTVRVKCYRHVLMLRTS